MTKSEKKILAKIRKWVRKPYKRYDFWFIYDNDNNAISWEGGFELPGGVSGQFRNQYSIAPSKRVVKNW